jgi:2-keto-4-pentenoate hydratase
MPVRVQTDDFDSGAEIRAMCADRADVGAVASFIGLVRDANDGSAVSGMYLEHYPGMTERALEEIVTEARGRWDIHDALVVHRVGELRPRDQIVLVVVTGAHRGEAFAACEFVMDYLKTRAPFWKREQTPTGPRWVEARDSDDDAAARWSAAAVEVDRIARSLAGHRLARTRLPRLAEGARPHDEAAAYAVQARLHELLAEGGQGRVAGHKIGCTTPVMQRYLGIPNPCAGMVFDSRTWRSGARLPMAAFVAPGVECEIAVRLGRDLPPRDADYTAAEVAQAVETMLPAIEVVDDRYVDYRSFDLPTLLADDFFNAGCVLGEPIGDWRTLDLAGLVGITRINGREVGRGRVGDVEGHPFAPLAWLATSLSRRGRGLLRGEFVLTGSVVETRWLAPGDDVVVSIEGLGEVRAVFEP